METEIIVGQDENLRDVTKRVRLIGRKVHLLRMENPNPKPILLTDHARDTTGWYEILAVSDDCKYFKPEHVGMAVWLKALPIDVRTWSWYVGPSERIVREEWFERPDGPPFMVVETGRKV